MLTFIPALGTTPPGHVAGLCQSKPALWGQAASAMGNKASAPDQRSVRQRSIDATPMQLGLFFHPLCSPP
jgi:hypothetical protein